MPTPCNRKNPLARSGTHQKERYRQALVPESVMVDERSTADLIMWAERFSRHIRYYSAENQAAGSWQPFFSWDISFVLAGLSQLPVEALRRFERRLQAYLSADPGRAVSDLAAHFKLFFHLPLLLLQEAGRHWEHLPRPHPLRAFASNLLAQDGATALEDLVKFYKGALALDQPDFIDGPLEIADYNTDFDDNDPRLQLPAMLTERIAGAAAVSGLKISRELLAHLAPGGWSAFYAALPADTAPYVDSSGDFYGQIYDALNFNLLGNALAKLFQTLERLALEATQYLQASLIAHDQHTPHYGLWLAFLRLFKFNQQHLNTLTRRHLDFYYREVLQLRPHGSVPDRVHLLFELSKNVKGHLLPAASTLFRAGKDDSGREVAYRLDTDLVVNRAAVASLKSFYRPIIKQGGRDLMLPCAAEVTNSRDGKGEKLPKDAPQFKPFGPFKGAANARIGFVLADRQLFLREGRRKIVITAELKTSIAQRSLAGVFTASLTTADGWLEAIPTSASVESDTVLKFEINLNGEHPAIVPYDPSVHGQELSVSEPVVKIAFAFDRQPEAGQAFNSATRAYAVLRNLAFSSIHLQVEAENIRNFTLQNEAGLLDTSKPFLPFGPIPTAHAPLIIGSSEVFSKKLESLAIQITWEKRYTAGGYFLKKSPSDFHLSLSCLKNGAWQNISEETPHALFGTTERAFTSDLAGRLNAAVPITKRTGLVDSPLLALGREFARRRSVRIDLTKLDAVGATQGQTLANAPYGPTSRTGFIRLELNTGFGHKKYIEANTLALINVANNPNWTPPTGSSYNYDGQLPREPYTPKINDIHLNYATAASKPARFYHLYPFGVTDESTVNGRLWPVLPNEGELYIGLKELVPPQRLTLLFQTLEGSANPLKGEKTLAWHYLRRNEWIRIEGQALDDKTANLTGSGIVALAIPVDADTDHTLLPADLHWVRLSTTSDADALNELLSIDAQAALASFSDQDNDPAFLATPLAPGTISKLKESDAAIKKIRQPYASFGGRPSEADAHYYVRVSERLRHKQRAVSMWDYEHLVLEHFPQVYKVKCINHTQLQRDLDNNILADDEMKPGHVLVVPIAYMPGRDRLDGLRPYTDKKTLVAIDRFLRQRISPFVQLEVQNPKIEEVQVRFSVAFTEDIADIAFYKAELNLAIIRFLSPWVYEEGAEISFGGKWHKAAIINFVEEQFFVDHVQDFEMYHKADIHQHDENWHRVDMEVIEATTSRSILVSHARHDIVELA